MPRPEPLHWGARQAFEARAAAAVRALAGRPLVHFEAGRPRDGDQPLPDTAPHLQPQPGLEDLTAYRGLADALSLRLLYSDPARHAHHRAQLPQDDAVAALLFDWLEQWRCESLLPDYWPGMRQNLQGRFERWTQQLLGSGLTETTSGLLLLCFAQSVWSRLTGAPLSDWLADQIEATRKELGQTLAQALARLRRERHDQDAYAQTAQALSIELSRRFAALAGQQQRNPRSHTAFRILLPATSGSEDPLADLLRVGQPVTPDGAPAYAVWTRRHDRVQDAASLVRPALLQEFRQQLDQERYSRPWPLEVLVRALRRALQQPVARGRQFHQEEGQIDGRRLARLITSPSDHAVFQRARVRPVVQARITLLIDCSGSMKHHRLQLALMMDLLGRAFERADIAFELLGFTTQAWNGGLPAREWIAQGRQPAQPGRLNALHHLVFRSHAMSRQQGQLGLAAVLKPDLFREGIDGEAVQWACERLRAQDRGGRKILWVVSDGGPMDSASTLANGPGYLDAHLRQVVRHAMREQGIEVLGIGVGQDLSAFYPRCTALDLEQGLELPALLGLIRTLGKR